MKNRKSAFGNKELLFKNLDFNKRWKNEIQDNHKKYSWLSRTVCQIIDFMAYGLYRDQPPAWKLQTIVIKFWTFSVSGLKIEPIHLSTETSATIVAALVAARGNADKPVEKVKNFEPEKVKFRFVLQETDDSNLM